jgi:DNA-binding XRE family transcriptional regulator
LKNIRLLRKNAGYTQTELAKELGVVQTTVSKWENDNAMPHSKLLPRLAEIFGCEIRDLY